MLDSGRGFKRVSIGKNLSPTAEILPMSEVAERYEFLKALPPGLKRKIEMDLMKEALEKQVRETLSKIRPGFGGKATAEELDEYANEVYEP